jgi:hypothetical protein
MAEQLPFDLAPAEIQRSLFEIPANKGRHLKSYTNTALMWDLLPKFDMSSSKIRYFTDLSMDELVRVVPVKYGYFFDDLMLDEQFVDLQFHITPALIRRRVKTVNEAGRRVFSRNDGGNYVYENCYVYPGIKEDKIEQALIYLLSHGYGRFKDQETGVSFTLNRIKDELHKTGTSYSLDEIKESLEVLSKARGDLYGMGDTGKKISLMRSTYLSNLLLVERDTYESSMRSGEKDQIRCYAQFHAAITHSIGRGIFRLNHYRKHQRLSNPLGRYMHKLLRVRFTNAFSTAKPFDYSFNRLIAESGRTHASTKSNKRLLDGGIEDLIECKIMERIDVDNIHDQDDGRTIVDRIVRFYPSPEFIDEMKKSNGLEEYKNGQKMDYRNTKELQARVNDLGKAGSKLTAELKEIGINTDKALELIERFGEGYVRHNVRHLNWKNDSTTKIQNPAGYLIKALEDGYIDQSNALIEGGKVVDIEVDGTTLDNLPDHIKTRVLDAWPTWSYSDKLTFNKNGLATPYIRELLGLM